MDSRTEQKEFISYSKIDEQIILSDKFKQINFETRYPDNLEQIINKISELRVPNKIPQIECVPSLHSMYEYFNKLIHQAKYNEISLPDLHDQIYNKLFNDGNIVQINKALDTAFKQSKISILQHFQVREFLRNLVLSKDLIAAKVNEEKIDRGDLKDDQEKQKLDHVKSLQCFAHDSGLITYLKDAIDNTLTQEIKEWEEYKKISEKLNEVELQVYMIKKHSDWSVFPFFQNVLALRKLKRDAEKELPLDNKFTAMAAEFSTLDTHDLETYINFINKYHVIFPNALKEKVAQDVLTQKINLYIENKPKQALIEILIPPSDIKDSKKVNVNLYHYQDVQSEVNQFIESASQQPDNINELLEYTLKLLEENIARTRMYLLAFLQNAIDRIFCGNAVDDGIAWMSRAISKILLQKDLKPETQTAIVQVALPAMLKLTEPGLLFNSVVPISVFPLYYNQDRNRSVFPTLLRDKFAEFINKKSMDEKSLQLPKYDHTRVELLADLSRKERVYIADLQKIIPAWINYSARDERLLNKLLLRLVAINYLRNKIQSDEELSSKQIRDEMLKRFGGLVFETRKVRDSYRTKIIARFDLPSMNGAGGLTNSKPLPPNSPRISAPKVSAIGVFNQQHVQDVLETKADQGSQLKTGFAP